MARKDPTVLDWLSTIDNGSDRIETVICFGAREICKWPSPQWLERHGPPGPLEAAVQYVTITQCRITIQAKAKDATI